MMRIDEIYAVRIGPCIHMIAAFSKQCIKLVESVLNPLSRPERFHQNGAAQRADRITKLSAEESHSVDPRVCALNEGITAGWLGLLCLQLILNQ